LGLKINISKTYSSPSGLINATVEQLIQNFPGKICTLLSCMVFGPSFQSHSKNWTGTCLFSSFF
jgi:hypothetical protein